MKLKHPVLGNLELREASPGVVLSEQGHYFPNPADPSVWVNPPGPSFGQISSGDVLRLIIAFGAINAAKPFSRNVFHFVLKGITGSPTFAAVATELLNQAFNALKTGTASKAAVMNYGATHSFQKPEVINLTDSTESTVGNMTAPGTLTSPAGLIPLRSAAVMSKATAKRGRSFQGRAYWPAPDEKTQQAGVMTADAVAAFQGTATALRELSLARVNTGASAAESVYSPTESKKTGALVTTPITANTMRGTLGSQRRRQSV